MGASVSAEAAVRVELPVCTYRGVECGGSEHDPLYLCEHPRVWVTNARRCAGCSYRAADVQRPSLVELHEEIRRNLLINDKVSPTPAESDFEDEEPRQPVVNTQPIQPVALVNGRRTRKPQQPPKTWGPPQDPNLIVTREGKPAGLANVWLGEDLFIVLSGPSLKTLPLDKLHQRGVVTLAVNNAACVYRPTFWTHVDPAEKFHEAIWHDPGIIKLVPQRRFSQEIRVEKDGELAKTGKRVADCPSVFGFKHGATFDPLTYLTSDFVCLGNNKKAHLKNGRPHNINVMFPLFRLAYYLGFRRVYLLGCDFKMPRHGPVYAFDEDKDAGARDSNNCTYLKLNQMLGELVGPLRAAGVAVYNCYRESGLRAFPYLSFDEAVEHATRNIPRSIRTSGWYEKSK